ncbi:MAG: MogA/MoaB family molybdenum cofactor biosynthesis protein [Candidatus Bathyarchaeota archaeon]|nr:MAG: MogA/MoaB family molybdenum cofactor biosynthesis protein [Candidatus Bathyarchaeota archaeon]
MSDSSQQHKAMAPHALAFSLITCSTSRWNALQRHENPSDPSADLVASKLEANHYQVVSRTTVNDDPQMIKASLVEALKDDRVDAVITIGGTGASPRDISIETVMPMLDKVLPGFGELFRSLSYETIGSAAILSRAIAGIVKGKAVFCIPGSINAATLCLDRLILPEAGHIVKHAREN